MENPSVSTENPTVAELKPKTGRAALVSSRGEPESLPHQFQVATFLKPTFCEHCGDMIWEMGIGKLIFKQKYGVRCKVCSTVVHKCCESKVVNSCIAIDTSAQQEESSELLVEVNKTLESEGSHKLYFKQHNIKTQKYCNLCRGGFHAPKQIVCCEFCQYNLHKRCFKKLNPQNFPRACKKWFFYEEEQEKATSNIHEWVEGNVESNFCLVCKKAVGTRTELSGFNCSWCHSSVHNECIADVAPGCDLGLHKELIVPPICVKRLSKEPHTNELVNFYQINNVPSNVTPLLVFINRKSGGQQGTKLFRKFNRILNPVQVFDLSAGGPAPGLELFKNVANCKVLVCGGDGTAGWYLHTVDKMELTNPPGCAILPLGTGNDLARSLGWGPGYEGESLEPILYKVMNSKVAELDRWSVAIGAKNADGSYEDPKQVYVMNNYFSVGADAKVALKFHEQREAHPERFKSRIGNKITYTSIGSKAAFDRTVLNKEMTIEANGQKVEIPNDAEGLVILNLDNYGAGINLWGTKSEEKFKTQSFRDGMFEVVTINSTFHLGAIKVHLANATRICQASEITLKIHSNSLAAQVDGEPWMQPPAIIHISHLNRGQMLVKED